MIVYRITGRKYAGDLSGAGASRFGGRWNRKGRSVLYTGESIEIALLEALVHVPYMIVPAWDLLILDIPENSVTTLPIPDLPRNWKHYPAPTSLAEMGEKWLTENNTVALKVPSCIIPTSWNFILNCSHPEYEKVRIINRQPFEADRRLLRTGEV